MEKAGALTAMEKRRLMDLARVVPDTLLRIGTSKGVLASIDAAYILISANSSVDGEADDPGSSSISPGGGVPLNTTCDNLAGLCPDDAGPISSGAGGSCHDVGGEPLNTTCDNLAGLSLYDASPLSSSAEGSYHDVGGVSPNTTCDSPAPWFDGHDVGGASSSSTGAGGHDIGGGVPTNTTGGSLADPRYDGAALDLDFWTNHPATAVGVPTITKAYVEITRLVSLHREAGHVLIHCAARLGIQQGAHNLGGGQADNDASWTRWRDLRHSFVQHAHTVLLRLNAAASAAAAIADINRPQPVESPRWIGWSIAAKELVRDACDSLVEAIDSVELMHKAVLREYDETWMILSRA